jgi:hypothetical protein
VKKTASSLPSLTKRESCARLHWSDIALVIPVHPPDDEVPLWEWNLSLVPLLRNQPHPTPILLSLLILSRHPLGTLS